MDRRPHAAARSRPCGVRQLPHPVSEEGQPIVRALTAARVCAQPGTSEVSIIYSELGHRRLQLLWPRILGLLHAVVIYDTSIVRALTAARVCARPGIVNPIGVKVGPSTVPSELVALIQRLDPPPHTPGKVTLITRFGAGKVAAMLPPIIKAVQAAALPVVWICDAVHGNTFKSSNGYKTRPFDAVIKELQLCFETHTGCGSRLGGVHLELTGDNVTECVGGPQDLAEADLPLRYTTYCDPRLNYAQSLEIAFLLADYMKQNREAVGSTAGGDGPRGAKRMRK